MGHVSPPTLAQTPLGQMPRQFTQITRPDFLAEKQNAARDFGHQVNWDAVPVAKENAYGNKELKAGTPVSLVNGMIEPREDTADPATNPAEGILVSTANENSDTDSLSGYGIITGGVVIEDMLANGTVAIADVKSELQANSDYGFNFVSYSDDRGA